MPSYDQAIGSIIAGKYRVVGTLGQGGMGSVYEAINDAVGKRVAIKLLDASLADHPEFARRFELEAKAAALIDHPGIVDVLDMGQTDEGVPFIVMEHLHGITMRTLSKTDGALSSGQASAMMAPVLDALASAHAAGVVHRDLKPANIFLVVKPSPSVRILDFGISKFGGSDGAGMTKTGATLGTPAYMAPEQLRSGRNAGPASDLYAVGATLYALLTGHPPFEAESDFALVARVLTEAHRPLAELRPDLPPALTTLVDALLDKEPSTRPSDARQVRDALLDAAAPNEQAVFARAAQLMPRLRTASASDVAPKPSAPRRKAASTLASPGRSPALGDDVAPTPKEGLPAVRQAPPRQGTVVVAGLVAAVLLVGVIVVALLNAPSQPTFVAEPDAPTPLAAVQAIPPPDVTLTVTLTPATATGRLDGAEPCNPCTLTRARGVVTKLHAEAPGHQAADFELGFTESRALSFALTPQTQKPAATTKSSKVPLLGKNAKVIVIGEEPAPGAPVKGSTFGVAHHSDDLLREARDLRARGMEAEGQRVLDDELERVQAGSNRSAEAHVLRNQGNFAQDRGKCRLAEQFFQKSMTMFEGLSDESNAGMVANDLGLLAKQCPGVDGPLWLSKAVTKLKQAGDLPGVRKAANNLGVEWLSLGEFEKADRAFNDALSAANGTNDFAGAARVEANLTLVWLIKAGGEELLGGRGSPSPAEMAKARAHYMAGIAAAKRAGQTERRVCDYLGKFNSLCPMLKD
ncbi:MAG: protein kinase [Myxococcales bacterium]|nr:protein kinase [Myxococcales bacterium]